MSPPRITIALAAIAACVFPYKSTEELKSKKDTPAFINVFRGTVLKQKFGAGLLEIDNGGEVLRIHAHPLQLGSLRLGSSVALTCREVGGRNWIVDAKLSRHDVFYSVNGFIAGPIANLDPIAGRLTVGNFTFRAHPETLTGLVPGEQALVHFVEIESIPWVLAVELEAS